MKEFNYGSRISDNYHTSKDYEQLFDDLMSGKNNYVGFVAQQYQDDFVHYQRIALIKNQGLSIDVSSMGICYFYFNKESSKEYFIKLCQEYDLEYLEPTKEGI